MLKIYISGKISGLDPKVAKKKFDDAEIYLKSTGFEVINPMNFGEGDPNKTWKDYMIEDINMLFDCDGIYMLDNWGNSKGARVERAIAIELCLQITYQN
jgi:hypothetical protein